MTSNLIKYMFDTGALKFGNYTLSSGQKSNYYIDIKQMTLHSGGMQAIAEAVAREIELYDTKVNTIEAIGGPELGAVPIVGAVLLWMELFADKKQLGYIVRKQTKEYGTNKLLEGTLPDKSINVAVIEDVTTTGKSALRAIDILKVSGYKPVLVISVVDREQGAADKFKEIGVDFVSILKYSQIMKELEFYLQE